MKLNKIYKISNIVAIPETREKIIQLIRENPKITTQELAKRTGLTAKGVE